MPWRTADGHESPSLSEPLAVEARGWLTRHFGDPWFLMDDWLVFGDENGHRVDFLLNEDGSADLSLRISAREDSRSFCRSVCELALALECVFFSAEFWLRLEPAQEVLAAALARSRASEFVRDPIKVLRGALDRA
jgi:hypothetical protein